jgi:hypothetical protein
MPTSLQDLRFKKMLIDEIDFSVPNSMLDTAIEWIRTNLNPDDVFEKDKLEAWAESNDYKKE